MEAYSEALENEGENGKRALAILHLLGLFDRTVPAQCLDALLRKPAIKHLTNPLINLSDAERNFALKRLGDANLLSVNRDGSGALISVDSHPLLREFFALQLRTRKPGSWRAAHRRLYEHLCVTTPDEAHPTLEDLEPLYQAVAHGCYAGLYGHAFEARLLFSHHSGREIL